MGIVLADSRDMHPGPGSTYSIVDKHNRFYKRDRGTAGFGDSVKWTDYGGSDPVLTVRHNDASKYDLAVLLQATSPTAAPTAANSVLLVQNSGASIGAGKTLSFYNAAGSNAAVLVHSATNDVLKTTGGFWATGAVNVGVSLTATTAGDVLVEHALNVGTTITATGVGDGYLAGGLRIGTGTTGLATANGRVTAGEHFVLGVTGGQFRGVIAGSATDIVLVIGTATDTTAGDEHFAVTAAGGLAWGPGGAAARDLTFARSGAATGTFTGSLIVTSAVNAVLLVNQSGAAALNSMVAIQRASAVKGYIGLDASDQLALMNATPAVVALNPAATTFWLSTVPSARVTASGTTVGTASHVALQMDGTTYDTDSMYDATNKRLKATRAGKYRIAANARYPGNAAGGLRWTRLLLNGATVLTEVTLSEPAGTFGGSGIYHALSDSYVLAINDYITVDAYQDTGGNQTVPGNMAMEFASI